MLFATSRTNLRRSKEAVNPQDLGIGPLGFVFTEAHELAPSRVTNRFGEFMVLHHARDVQRFKDNRAKAVYQLATELVLIVLPLVSHPLMQLCQGQARLVAALAALDFATDAALAKLQAPFRLVQVLGFVELLTIRQGDEGLQAQINPDRCGLGL